MKYSIAKHLTHNSTKQNLPRAFLTSSKLHVLRFSFAVAGASLMIGCALNEEANTAVVDQQSQSEHPVSERSVNERPIKENRTYEIHQREAIKSNQRVMAERKKAEQGVVLTSQSYQMMDSSISSGLPSTSEAMPFINEYQEFEPALPSVEGENYAAIVSNPIKSVMTSPVSTFSVDVDTGSYSNVRRLLNQGVLPPKDSVRIEELVNYFDYQYPQPESKQVPFSVSTEVAQSPWSDHHLLLRIGLQGYAPEFTQRPPANLVFLLDVSGSMMSSEKLPLLKKSLLMLTRQLTESDRVSIVVYAGASGVVLEPTAGNDRYAIEQALDQLKAGGATNGQAGIQQAYRLAQSAFIKDGINRVVLATDGDFNVGINDVDSLKSLIEQKRKAGVSLTTLGFGRGNYNDHLMEQLANVGNGNYAYIDTLHEARKVLVDEMNATLMTIAKDVKLQLEFNPTVVSEYRLIGYENRALAREDFANDNVDAGEIGAGHRVTALYEIALVGSKGKRLSDLRYQTDSSKLKGSGAGSSKGYDASKMNSSNNTMVNELGYLKLRYKSPNGNISKLMDRVVELPNEVNSFHGASDDFKFAAVVAGFGQQLRGGKYLTGFDYQAMIKVAQKAQGNDPFGYRSEFIKLVRLADAISH